MLDWLLRAPLFLSILIISVVSVSVSILILVLMRKKLNHEDWKRNHEVASFIFNGYGLIYAVLIAFVVFAVWTDYEDAKKLTDTESILIFEIFLNVDVLNEPQRSQIRNQLIQYDSIVVNDEWELLERRQASDNARIKISEIFSELATYNPQNKTQEIVLQEIYDKIDNLVEARRTRVFYSSNRIPSIMWVVLIIGATLSIGFTYFFSMEKFLTQCLLTGAFTLMNVLILFLILVLDNSFTGDAKISNESFSYILNLMRYISSN